MVRQSTKLLATRWAGAATACALSFSLSAAFAAPAGADIVNTASVRLVQNGETSQLPSNTVSTRLGELLDVSLAQVSTTPEQVEARERGHVSAFVLTNAGNGQEAFALSAAISDIDATIAALWIDGNGDGLFNPADDTRLAAGAQGATPPVAPGARVTVFVLSNIGRAPASGSAGSLSLSAEAVTGAGTTGETFPQAGDNGSDAVVGRTTARAVASKRLIDRDMGVSFTKSQAVATAGGGQAGRGSIITYTLDARFTVPVSDARITDPIPDGTTYVPGSLRLDGAPLSDARDLDAGLFDADQRAVSITLGSSTAAVSRQASFQVQIN